MFSLSQIKKSYLPHGYRKTSFSILSIWRFSTNKDEIFMSTDAIPKELEAKLDAIIRQIISEERKNYLDNSERVRSITANVKSIIEENMERVIDET